MKPPLTVLMAVHNGERYLQECVKSVLTQTFSDFRFLILDDGSTDKTREIIRSFQDPRIELVEIPERGGQMPALNQGLSMIDSPLIARMDADDTCFPQRFARQVEYMDDHPEIGTAGTYIYMTYGKKTLKRKYPLTHDEIKARLLFGCCLSHPSVIMRKQKFDEFQLRYDENLGHSEDWDLWQRASQCFPLANIPEFLLDYRVHEESVSFKTERLKRKTAEILTGRLLDQLGIYDSQARAIHLDIATATFNFEKKGMEFIIGAREWLNMIEKANDVRRIYRPESLSKELDERFFSVLYNNTEMGWPALDLFIKERLYRHAGLSEILKFTLKALLLKHV